MSQRYRIAIVDVPDRDANNRRRRVAHSFRHGGDWILFEAEIDEVHVVPLHPLEAHPDVGLDVLHDVADVERPVRVRERRGDEKLAGH